MMMAGCTNGDRVDEVRVGQVQIVGHGVVLNRAISEVCVVFYGRKKISGLQE
jgi:hypothetical protein